jgi:Antitoxin Xre/MbcA/ParS C-terminal toxin-binding domain
MAHTPASGEGDTIDPLATEPAWRPRFRTRFLIETLGGATGVADFLGVSDKQPVLWQDGMERPEPEVARLIVDLDHVVARAVQLWTADVVMTWLRSPNPYLESATPLNVLRSRGAAEVLEALDATLSGAYA